MKRLILPTDFSNNAYNAISYAINLFKNVKCTFHLLNVYKPLVYVEKYEAIQLEHTTLIDANHEASLIKLKKLRKRIAKNFKNPKHTFIENSSANKLLDEILATQEQEAIDLIIMGTQGITDTKDVIFGTNALQLIKKSTCPVIAVPANYNFKVPKLILFPADFDLDYEKEALKELLYIAKQHRSKIEVLYVSDGYDELTEDQLFRKTLLKDCLKGVALTVHFSPHSDISDSIEDFRLQHDIQLLAILRLEHSFLDRLFYKSVLKEVGLEIKIPFMVVPHDTND